MPVRRWLPEVRFRLRPHRHEIRIGIRRSLHNMGTTPEAELADEQTFDELLGEFRRVGVDPDTFSAMLALRPEDALRALRALPDDAGATAFLGKLRQQGLAPTGELTNRDTRRDDIVRHRRDKSA